MMINHASKETENSSTLYTIFLTPTNKTHPNISDDSDYYFYPASNSSWIPSGPVPKAVEALMYIMYIVISVAAIGGNVIVCYIVFAYQRMRSVTNFFIANLAVGDILMASLCIPFGFVSNLLLQYWPFGAVMCVVVSYAQAVSVFISAYTLVAISFDRYIAILYPLRPRMTKLQAKLIIALIWLVALLTPLPTAIMSKLEQPQDWIDMNLTDRYTCMEAWESNSQRYHYSMALMVLQYFFPLAVLIYTYTRIAVVVWGKKAPGEAHNARDERMAASKRKMVKMMIVCVCVFTLCWLPFNSLMVVGDQYPELYELPNVIYLWFACHWLAMSHACYNPAIYCWMNEKYRHGFKMVFRCMANRPSSMAQQSTMNLSLATSVKRTTTRVDVTNANNISRAWGQTRFNVVGDEHDVVWQFSHIHYVWFICHWLAMSSASYNPVIYCWMNTKYREGFLHVFRRLSCSTDKDSPLNRNGFSRSTNNTIYTSIRSSGTHRSSLSSTHRGSFVNGQKYRHRTESGTVVIRIEDSLLQPQNGTKDSVSKV